MSNELNHAPHNGHGDYERRDISVAGVLYFLVGLALFGALAYLVAAGLFSRLEKQSAAEQVPVSPLVTTAPTDTRHIQPDYPRSAFPDPKLEEDERGQLNGIRLKEEQTLSTYDYIDKNAGTVRIPIDRAMDLVEQRGLPVRGQSAGAESSPQPKPAPEKIKAAKK